jgi:hypothetical protein
LIVRAVWAFIAFALVSVLVVLLTVRPTSAVAGSPVADNESTAQDQKLVTDYFTELNSAGKDGPTTQRDFLRRTQHPDFTDRICDLGELTLKIEPAMSTFRFDLGWTPEGARHPRGTIYVLGVAISIRRGGALLGEQIGSQRVVVLDGKAYGFTPCPTQ